MSRIIIEVALVFEAIHFFLIDSFTSSSHITALKKGKKELFLLNINWFN